MIPRYPLEITPRKCVGVHVGRTWISLEVDGASADGRIRYRWDIDLEDGGHHSGTDMHSAVGGGPVRAMVGGLLAFLIASAESYWRRIQDRKEERAENERMFPPEVVEWAHQNSEELVRLHQAIGGVTLVGGEGAG